MRFKYLSFLLAAFVLFTFSEVNAQQRPVKRRNSAYGNPQQQDNNQQQPPANTQKQGEPDQSAYGNNNSGYTGIDTTLPIQVVQSTGNGLLDSVKISLRNDGAVEKNLVKERLPLEYEDIREDDAVYMVRVWREIDTREKLNQSFRYSADNDNGNQRFISILLGAIKNGDVTAFSGDDDRFTTPITYDDAVNTFGGGMDTVKAYDEEGNIAGYKVMARPVDPDSIYKFRIKEEWIFDKESSRLYVRIIGIAPVIPYKLSTGDVVANSDRPVWWVYYPDLRPVLAKYDVYNPKNFASQMTWEELFESRMFSSYIVKSTIDNPLDVPLSSVYPDNTLFRLLDGEKIKDKIFNYEQSLWSY